ncbi:MAG: hypothetical protein LBD46_08505 [Endomicrobium sp.]|nr:hypothetical protein [Endomicrobium sp.]
MAYASDIDRTTAEVMTEENPILEDIHFQEENSDNGNKFRERAKMPEVVARKYNQGITASKGGVLVKVDPRTELISKLEIDESYLSDFGAAAARELADEQFAHRTANGEKLGRTLFYGSKGAESLYGIIPRYNTLNPKYSVSEYVIDASTGVSNPSNLGSIVLVSWGPKSTYAFYPKNSKGGLEEGALTKGEIDGVNGGKLPGYYQYFKWKIGLTVKDYRSVVRICNIDTVKGKVQNITAGVPDLEMFIMEALRILKSNGGNVVAYAGRDVMKCLDQQALGRYKRSYPTSGFAGKLITNVNGIPFRQQDCLLAAEELVTYT